MGSIINTKAKYSTKDCYSMLVQNMAILVVAREKNLRLLWNKHAEDEAEGFFLHRI